jgi:SSS family solute:Na+ symporter
VLIVLLAAYAVLLVLAGAYVSRRVRSSGDFFVAGRGLSSGLVFVTLLAANIGAGSTVGATGLGYRFGLSAWWWSGSAALGSVGLGLFVAPRLHRLAAQHGFLTVGDYLEARYDRSVRGLIGAVLWLGTLSILAGQLIAMAWAFEVVAGLPKTWGCLLGGAILVAYFSRGGLVASVWVNLIELVMLLVGFALAVVFAWFAVGGWPRLSVAGGPGYTDGFGMGPGPILGLLLILGPSFMVSPGLVQKTYGAKSAGAARSAVLWNAAALAAFAFIPPLLGMAARVLHPQLVNPELALPLLMRSDALPPWLGGLGLAALFAAEISTADAVLFMLSTSLAQDLYRTFLNPGADDALLLRVSRWTSFGAGCVGALLAVVLPSVVDALKSFYGILTAALFVPLVAGLLSDRPRAVHARAAVVLAVGTYLTAQLLARGSAVAAWAPQAGAMAVATAVLGLGFLDSRNTRA